MKYLSGCLLAVFTFLGAELFAQTQLGMLEALALTDQRLTDLAEINNLPLRKVYVDYLGRYLLSRGLLEMEYMLYFDAQGRIRKRIVRSDYPEGADYSFSYFNEEGFCIYSNYGCFSGHDGNSSELTIRDDEGRWIHTEHLDSDGEGRNVPFLQVVCNNSVENPMDSLVLRLRPEFGNISEVSSTQSIIWESWKEEGVDSLLPPMEYTEVRFVTPRVGDETHANYNFVPVYKRATEDSRIVGRVDISYVFTVIGVKNGWLKIRRQSENDFGPYAYKDIIGYIRTERVEPVELVGKVVTTAASDKK